MKSHKELIGQLLESAVKAELLVLFRKNPGLIDTVEGIARRIGRTSKAIEKAIEDFTHMGLLQLKRYGESVAFSFNWEKDREIQDAILEWLGEGATE
jgi:predicted transcriptional regulator